MSQSAHDAACCSLLLGPVAGKRKQTLTFKRDDPKWIAIFLLSPPSAPLRLGHVQLLVLSQTVWRLMTAARSGRKIKACAARLGRHAKLLDNKLRGRPPRIAFPTDTDGVQPTCAWDARRA
ncbi:hypothetical protein MTO96_006957 [Rhipicephalus appendiculatus]